MNAVSPLAFIELAVVGAFAAAWLILELVCKRLDSKRTTASRDKPETPANAAEPAEDGH
jgi:hypothetical protein